VNFHERSDSEVANRRQGEKSLIADMMKCGQMETFLKMTSGLKSGRLPILPNSWSSTLAGESAADS
jgi:hypothetical protein